METHPQVELVSEPSTESVKKVPTQPSVPRWLKWLVIGQAMIIVGLLSLFVYFTVTGTSFKQEEINSFEECVKAGNPVMESYPEQCMTKDKRTFTRELTQEEQQSKSLVSPTPIVYQSDDANQNWFIIGKYQSMYQNGELIIDSPTVDIGIKVPVSIEHKTISGQGNLDNWLTVVELNGVSYTLLSGQGRGGPCAFEQPLDECSYTDETFPVPGLMQGLRIWRKDRQNIFALNPWEVTVDETKLDTIYITKTDQSFFTLDEYKMWQELLKGLTTVTQRGV